MKKLLPLFLLLFVCTLAVDAQTELPDRGTLSEIAGKRAVYLIAEGPARPRIEKRLAKSKLFEFAQSSEAADFFLEYLTISRQPFGYGGTSETGELRAYYLKSDRRVVVWSASVTGGGFKGDTADRLCGQFLKAFSKLQ